MTTFANTETTKDEAVIVAEDILIKDKILEKKLIKRLKENGTLTSTRQVGSFVLVILCDLVGIQRVSHLQKIHENQGKPWFLCFDD